MYYNLQIGEANKIKKKILGVFVIMLFIIAVIFPLDIVIARGQSDPEIEDEEGDSLIKGLDIISVWFSDDGENLTVTIKLAEMIGNPILWSHFTVFWKYNDKDYHIGCSIRGSREDKYYDYHYGYRFAWFWFPSIHFWSYYDTNGSIDEEECEISIEFPLSFIENPDVGEKLTDTHAMTHLLGLRDLFILTIPIDHAPARGTYGWDYIIGSQ